VGADWDRYVRGFHGQRAGITEAVLGRTRAEDGTDPYTWLAEPIGHDSGVVVDLACGSAPL
jgi:hypothetical protein